MAGATVFRRLLAATRFLILVPVICIFLTAGGLLVYGVISTAQVIGLVTTAGELGGKASKALLLEAIQLVDMFLLGTVLYVIAIGLYELFIDDSLGLPAWLVIHNLDDLKEKLIGVVIVVMGVLFLGQLITWDGQSDLLNPGASIALVIAALSYFLSLKKRKGEPAEKE
jgi:uncharacterized membrane protein YqhA